MPAEVMELIRRAERLTRAERRRVGGSRLLYQ